MEWFTVIVCIAFVIGMCLLFRWLYKDRKQEKEIHKQWQELKRKSSDPAEKKLSDK